MLLSRAACLADTGMTVAREDLALEAAFWAQLPGNFAMRPRKAPITSRNFAAMVPFHNYPAGRAVGNHWGEALALLSTSAHSPYYFSLHASDPTDPDGGSRKDTGHTFICGPTGSGKTVFIGFLVAMLHRQGATQVIFDKDRGLGDSRPGAGRRVFAAEEWRTDGIQPVATRADARAPRVSENLAPRACVSRRRSRIPIGSRRCRSRSGTARDAGLG